MYESRWFNQPNSQTVNKNDIDNHVIARVLIIIPNRCMVNVTGLVIRRISRNFVARE